MAMTIKLMRQRIEDLKDYRRNQQSLVEDIDEKYLKNLLSIIKDIDKAICLLEREIKRAMSSREM